MSRLELVNRLCAVTANMSASGVAELRSVCEELRDKDALGHGSYKKDDSSEEGKKPFEDPVLFHGTSVAAAHKILGEGIKAGSEHGSVFATGNKGIAANYAVGAGRSHGIDRDDDEVAIVSIRPNSNLEKWQSDDIYEGKAVKASDILKVEIFKLSDLTSGKQRITDIEPMKTYTRSSSSKVLYSFVLVKK